MQLSYLQQPGTMAEFYYTAVTTNMSNITFPGNSCPVDPSRNSCAVMMDSPALAPEITKRDVIATIRLLVSCLSILGALSIIMSALIRRQACNPKIHPIFVLSIADCFLGSLWVIGSIFWFANISDRKWCFVPSLLTVIMECVTVNLTLVYAVFSYTTLKRKDLNKILANMEVDQVCSPTRTVLIYLLAWTLPAIIMMIGFGVVAELYNIVANANNCSCRCIPHFGNVLPLSFVYTGNTSLYFHHMRKLVITYGALLGTNYLVVFVLLVIIYYKILKRIRTLRKKHEQIRHIHPNYGTVDVLLTHEQSRAKKRVVYFLVTFIVTGLANVILSYSIMIYESVKLQQKYIEIPEKEKLPAFPMIMYIVQSFTAPLQGFLNALVYGWTREDFMRTIAQKRAQSSAHEGNVIINSSSEEEEEEVKDSSVRLVGS